MGDTLWLVAIAMENSPFIDDLYYPQMDMSDM